MKFDVLNRHGAASGNSLLVALGVCFLLQTALPGESEAFTKRPNFSQQSMSNKPMAADTETEDGEAYYDNAARVADGLNDYVVDSAVYTYSGSRKPVVETCKFFFKKPDLVRAEVEKAGIKSGSILVLGPDHEIHAKPGSLLKFMKIDLSPDSALLKTANGFSLLKCDYATLMRTMKAQAVKSGCRFVLAKSPIAGAPSNVTVRHLQFVLPTGVVLQRIAFDDTKNLPIEWTLFTNGQVFSTSVWSNLNVNADLADSLFTLN